MRAGPNWMPDLPRLGAAVYLFLRAMGNDPDAPSAGVVHWSPPIGLIEATSDLLAGADVEAVLP